MFTLIKNIKGLAQVRPKGISKVSGADMDVLPMIKDAYLLIQDQHIHSFGKMADCPSQAVEATIDAKNKFVLPSYVDSHTHLVFAASREEEFVMKIKGASYADIAAKGGGILNSAKKLQKISEDELFERSIVRAWEIISQGTGAVEIKSGYGLTVKDEMKMLKVAQRIGQETPLTVKTTFLGAHAVPKEYSSKQDYIDLVVKEMIPQVAEQKLANYIDAFCEDGFFTAEETEKIMEAGKAHGLIPKIHANQLNRSGGVQVGVKTGALSVDHLECMGQEEIDALSTSEVMPTALPGAAYFLNTEYPPARDMLNAGLPLAIATDYNPGSAPCGRMATMMNLACVKMRMTPNEVFNACTINTAYAMGLSDSHGSITEGKVANLIITDEIPSLDFIPYAFGTDCIDEVVLNGELV